MCVLTVFKNTIIDFRRESFSFDILIVYVKLVMIYNCV